MKFLLTFKVVRPGQQYLPLSYQYELSAWIYKRLYSSDSGFANWLHDRGYTSGGKRFKFFNFTRLSIPQYHIQADRMRVDSPVMRLELRFLADQTAQHLIMGLFDEQRFSLGDRESWVDLQVERVELLPEDELRPRIRLTARSPIVVSSGFMTAGGKLQHRYHAPTDEGYGDMLLNNLVEKYGIAATHGLLPPPSPGDEAVGMDFRLLSPPEALRSHLITIKSNDEERLTRIRGYSFDFELQAPEPLVRLALLAGVGTENALGFGAVGVRR